MTVRILVILFLLLLPSACSSPRGVYHTVHEGQTLYRIGRVYEVDERYLARINRIDDPTQLRVGTRLYIPGATRLREVPSATAKAITAPSAPRARSSLPPAAPKAKAPAAQQRPSSAPTPAVPPRSPAASKPAAAVAGKFAWPLKGNLLKGFGGNGSSPIKGLEIAANRGTPIHSAAAGRVIYSGDGIRSYGNLIILKHDDDFFTVYGFNDKNIVEVGSFVSKGERIALSGVPPAGGKPRLYFEIRRGKEPVDPIFYLP
jgi:lipoprotein NlpD